MKILKNFDWILLCSINSLNSFLRNFILSIFAFVMCFLSCLSDEMMTWPRDCWSHTLWWFKNTCRACSLLIHRLDSYECSLFKLKPNDFLKCLIMNVWQPNCYTSFSFVPSSLRLWIQTLGDLFGWAQQGRYFCLEKSFWLMIQGHLRKSPIMHTLPKDFCYQMHGLL